jgi:rhodanese-related sulfurtransferase
VAAFQSHPVDNVPVRATWERLQANPSAILIDVRTRAEWSFVGIPDTSSLGRQVVLVEWLKFPENRQNPAFVSELTEQLEAASVGKDSELYFICRSGARSRHAAEAMKAAGYAQCFNVAEGFEGPLDDAGHRGVQTGWKAEGLPWVQS